MLRVLLACLLITELCFQAQAYGNPSQAEATRPSKDGSLRTARYPRTAVASAQAVAARLKQFKTSRLPIHASVNWQEEQDSVQADDNQFESLSSSLEFEVAATDVALADRPIASTSMLKAPAAPLGPQRFRSRLIRTNRHAQPEVVEILTCTEAGPLVLALLPASSSTPAQVLAGAGHDRTQPLRPLELTQAAVLRLCGNRAAQVRAYAMTYDLHFQQATDVARMLDYFNRLAVVVKD